MSKTFLLLATATAFAVSLFAGSSAAGQEPSQTQEPVRRPRIVGHGQSFQEVEAWKKVEEETNLKRRSEQAQQFLEEFPDGGYAPYAHEVLALHYQQSNELEKFFEHAEKALEDLPEESLLLAGLSTAYAEQQKPDEAIERGERALKLLPTQEAPLQLSPEQWEQQRDLLLSDALYGVGTGYLFRAYTSGGSARLMALAVEHLEKAVEVNPEHERAHFRLGFGYQMMDDLEKAILSYARAAALEGANAPMARQQLTSAYQTVHKNTSGMDRLISRQKQYLKEQKKNRADKPER